MKAYFEGWYLKQQSETDSLALIPSCHYDERGTATGSLQVVTPEWSRQVSFVGFEYGGKQKCLVLGENCFSRQCACLNLQVPGLTLSGTLCYGPLLPPPRDVMGPFRFLPFLQCRHSVFSLRHSVTGSVTVNGKRMVFDQAVGYMEGDRGRSFPERYLWTQCSWGQEGVMLSVADVPLWGRSITGCIALVWLEGKIYRLATYLGAKVVRVDEGGAELRQGKLHLEVAVLEQKKQTLLAPQQGSMTRTIHESLCATVRYRLWLGDHLLLDRTSSRASFEGMWL